MIDRPVVVADVDTGIDDALAVTYLALLHNSGRIRLRVTTSAGNCTAQQAAANTADVLANVVRTGGLDNEKLAEITVRAGAPKPQVVSLTTTPETHGPTGLGYHRTAANSDDFPANVAAAVATWEGADFILIAGPATNLAWAAQHTPHILANTRIVLMSGAFNYPGNTTEHAEWNAWVDPHALATALELVPQPMTFCPLNVTEQVLLAPERLKKWNQPLLENALRFYFEFHQQAGVGYTAQIHDLAAAMVLLGTVDYTTCQNKVSVDLDAKRGQTRLGVGYASEILTDLEPAAVFEEFERALPMPRSRTSTAPPKSTQSRPSPTAESP